jgi:small subunit ribosomal protein S20
VANIKSQKKRNITNESGDEDAVKAAIKRIDTAAQKGIIHKNTAARKKSRLLKRVKTSA